MSNFDGDREHANKYHSSVKRANNLNPVTWSEDIETGQDVGGDNDQESLNKNLFAVKPGELAALPAVDNYLLNDIISVGGETYILREATGTNEFAGSVAGHHDHVSATTNSHAGAIPIYGQFTSDPDNAIAGVIAHTIGQLQILIKQSAYETAKGSPVAAADKITALISAGSPSKTDTITLARLASHDYSDDGVDYIVFQYADNDGDLNFWRIAEGTAWTMRVFEGTGTNTPLLIHADNLKHWVLYHYDDETRLDAEVQRLADELGFDISNAGELKAIVEGFRSGFYAGPQNSKYEVLATTTRRAKSKASLIDNNADWLPAFDAFDGSINIGNASGYAYVRVRKTDRDTDFEKTASLNVIQQTDRSDYLMISSQPIAGAGLPDTLAPDPRHWQTNDNVLAKYWSDANWDVWEITFAGSGDDDKPNVYNAYFGRFVRLDGELADEDPEAFRRLLEHYQRGLMTGPINGNYKVSVDGRDRDQTNVNSIFYILNYETGFRAAGTAYNYLRVPANAHDESYEKDAALIVYRKSDGSIVSARSIRAQDTPTDSRHWLTDPAPLAKLATVAGYDYYKMTFSVTADDVVEPNDPIYHGENLVAYFGLHQSVTQGENDAGTGIELDRGRIAIRHTDFPYGMWGTNEDGIVQAMRMKEIRVDDQRGQQPGYEYHWKNGFALREDLFPNLPGGTHARRLNIHQKIDVVVLNNEIQGYESQRPGFTWDHDHFTLKFNGVDWSNQTAGTTKKELVMDIIVDINGAPGDTYNLHMYATDDTWFGRTRSTDVPFTIPDGHNSGYYRWRHRYTFAPGSLPNAGSQVKLQLHYASGSLGWALVKDPIWISFSLPHVNFVSHQTLDVDAPASGGDEHSLGPGRIMPIALGGNTNFLTDNFIVLGHDNPGKWKNATDAAKAGIAALGSAPSAGSVGSGSYPLSAGDKTGVEFLLAPIKTNEIPAQYRAAWVNTSNQDQSTVIGTSGWYHLTTSGGFEWWVFSFAASSISVPQNIKGLHIETRSSIVDNMQGSIEFTQDMRNVLVNLYTQVNATKTNFRLTLWSWIDGLVRPHVHKIIGYTRTSYNLYWDLGAVKAGQRFAIVVEGDPPETTAAAGNLHLEINTNVDTRFPTQVTLVPGLIRDTKCYFERVLADRNMSEIALNVNPIDVVHKESLISLYAAVRKSDGNARMAGTIPLQAQRALADTNNYALAGHWGSGQDETMRWDPDDNKVVLSGGPVAIKDGDVIEVWVEHYL